MIDVYEQVAEQLVERKKELQCLYSFSSLIQESESNVPLICQGLTEIIRKALVYPDRTSVKVTVKDESFFSDCFEESTNFYSRKILVQNKNVGSINAYVSGFYTETPFLPEEFDLINYLSDRTGYVIERINAYNELELLKTELEKNNALLKRKNESLSDVLDHLQERDAKRDNNIRSNLDNIIIPLINKLEHAYPCEPTIKYIRKSLSDIFTPYNVFGKNSFSNLTPREVEITRMIKSGLNSKEIGNALSLSEKTINTHRFRIRKKLGLIGSSQNLSSYLMQL